MNFQKITPVDSGKTILDLAFRKARERAELREMRGPWLESIKQKETVKLDIIKENIGSRLQKIMNIFPKTEELLPFYVQLMKLTLDVPMYRKSLASLRWVIQRLYHLHQEQVRNINRTQEKGKIGTYAREFYGRVSSLIKQIDPQLKYLEQTRLIMRTYPDIKEMFTVCIYGFPNVGKTTLLNKITGAKALVAPYAFTTKTINAGYFTLDGEKIQVLDVPGTLAREKLNLIELQAELVAKELAQVMIYVFDITEQSGFSLEQQEKLYEKVKHRKNLLVYYSKLDLLEKRIKLLHQHYSLEQIKAKILELAKERKELEPRLEVEANEE